jgi:hypothetical protein
MTKRKTASFLNMKILLLEGARLRAETPESRAKPEAGCVRGISQLYAMAPENTMLLPTPLMQKKRPVAQGGRTRDLVDGYDLQLVRG